MTATGSDEAQQPADRPMSTIVAKWLHLARRRMRERTFWVVQALVVAVTAIHIAVEATDLQHRISAGGLVELPVVLHIIPVVYAGFRYGYEGSVLTGLWSGVLAVPNIVFWHSQDYGWLADLTFIGFVIVLGVVIAVPVERERRQRRRAQAASRRLETLNRITAELSTMTDPHESMTRALEHLVGDMAVRTASLRAPQPNGTTDEPQVLAAIPRTHAGIRPSSELEHDPAHLVVPLDGRPDGGCLVVELTDRSQLGPDDRELLATAARQIGSALEARRLRLREQDRLRTYARQVTRAQERERSRIARDLHDVVAQELTLLTRRLHDLEDGRDTTSPRQLRDLADDILGTVRQVSRGLRPPELDDLGLIPALRSLTDDLAARTGVTTNVDVTGQPRRLPHETGLTLYRIAQEALHNAERHADPTEVTITITFDTEHIQVIIADDGQGFEPDATTTGTGSSGRLGLLGMQERAALAGGTLDITSDNDTGTTVTARIPV